MADRQEERGDDGRSGLADRLRASRATILTASGLGLIAWLQLDAPAWAAIAGVAAVTLATTTGGPARPIRRTAAARTAAGATSWPDTSMKLVIDALSDPCFLTDARGIVRYQNDAATERFGAPRPGDPLSFKLRVPELLAAVERSGRGEPVPPLRFSERVPTERLYVAELGAIRMARREGRPRERADFVLLRLRDETELMRLERMRGDFIANASHELRTPLASLTGFIETLLGPARNDEANRERFLNIMLEQAGRMARLIDDLLSLSRIELKAHVRPEAEVDLAEVVRHVLDVMAPLARENGVDLAGAIEDGTAFRVRGDRDELIQVVANLVENAIKYGRRDGHVEVSLVREPEADGGGCVLSVRDDGPGIDPEHLPRLTERFYRVDEDRSRRQKGTGLGLAIVKHIVNRHRGRLTIRSNLGEGSVFSVRLDLAGRAPRPAAGPEA